MKKSLSGLEQQQQDLRGAKQRSEEEEELSVSRRAKEEEMARRTNEAGEQIEELKRALEKAVSDVREVKMGLLPSSSAGGADYRGTSRRLFEATGLRSPRLGARRTLKRYSLSPRANDQPRQADEDTLRRLREESLE